MREQTIESKYFFFSFFLCAEMNKWMCNLERYSGGSTEPCGWFHIFHLIETKKRMCCARAQYNNSSRRIDLLPEREKTMASWFISLIWLFPYRDFYYLFKFKFVIVFIAHIKSTHTDSHHHHTHTQLDARCVCVCSTIATECKQINYTQFVLGIGINDFLNVNSAEYRYMPIAANG